jgi:prepilin-type N-terminal cleavage/methylation domain-containing protein
MQWGVRQTDERRFALVAIDAGAPISGSDSARAVQPSQMSIQDRDVAGENQWEEKEMDQENKREGGFTLIELLVAIVVVGILTAVAIVGIGGLTSTAHTASCKATLDSTRAGVAAYYAGQTPNKYPASVQNMIDDNDLQLQGGVVASGLTVKSDNTATPDWTITVDNTNGTVADAC